MKWYATAALFLGLAHGVSAENAKTYAGEITASQLRLRAGPGQAYQEVMRLAKGDRVIVLGKHTNSPEWLEVERSLPTTGCSANGRSSSRPCDATPVPTARS